MYVFLCTKKISEYYEYQTRRGGEIGVKSKDEVTSTKHFSEKVFAVNSIKEKCNCKAAKNSH
jgi:hypothetical protein